ncbi:MAG: diguanylate cyclase [Planctomycetota bacterium]|nr:diguanylate cyclase [Planctomycetota bacterium]
MPVPAARRWLHVAVCLVIVALIGVVDYFLVTQLSCATLYLFPILWAAWRAGFAPSLLVALASVCAWLSGDIFDPRANVVWHFLVWDVIMRASVYVILAYAVAALKLALDRESELARTDPLTEVPNARSFWESAAVELDRARRYQRPFTLAYLDVDNFKLINDQLGHPEGDTLLREVAGAIWKNVRSTDLVARVGGDEFVILFPETGQSAAAELLARVRSVLHDAIRKNGTPVTLSIGAVTFSTPPPSVDDMIKRADNLMYEVKRAGKNGVALALTPSEPPAAPAGSPAQA